MAQGEREQLGLLIKARREGLGLTQVELAERAGLSVETIRNYERGKGPQSSYWHTIRKLTAALELTPARAEYEQFVRLARPQNGERNHSKDRRAWLIDRVRTIWVAGVLDQRLEGLEFINLGMTPMSDAGGQPSSALVSALGAPSVHGPAGPSILEVFDALADALLIAGKAGSGKTVMLLALAKVLLGRAKSDRESPIPVVLPLASWASAQLPLDQWLADELGRLYLVPRELAQQLIDEEGLVLLLDGLDEVRPEQRDACIMAINTFRQTNRSRLVVTCRTSAYQALPTKPDVDGALELQPLSDTQVQAVLTRAGSRLAAVRDALQSENTESSQTPSPATPGGKLRELATSPLMLSIIVLLYSGVDPDELPAYRSLEAQRRNLLDAYLSQMLGRPDYPSYSAHQTRAVLQWLAQQLQCNGQTLFFLDRLQPNWLPLETAQRAYYLVDRLGGGLLAGLILCLGYAAVVVAYGASQQLGATYWAGLLPDLLLMLLVGGMLGGLFGGHPDRQPEDTSVFWSQVRERVIGWMSGGLLLGAVFLAVTADIPSAIMCSLIGALGGLLMGRPTLGMRSVVLVDERQWSWERTVRQLPAYLSAGVVVGLLVGFFVGQVDGLLGQLLPPLTASVVAGILTGMLASAIFGVTYRDDEEQVMPNQGIWRSGRNALRSSLEGALGGALFGALVMAGPVSWVITALIGGLLGALACGGTTVISHVALRLVIWQFTPFPLRGMRFLEHAVERGVLQRVGGGYQFLHPLLRDHLAWEATTAAAPVYGLGMRMKGGPHRARLSRGSRLAAVSFILVALGLGALVIPRGQSETRVLAQPDLIIDTTQPGYAGMATSRSDVSSGDTVTVLASGTMAIGPWSRHVGPAGVDRGGLGFPLGNVFKRQRDFPTGALLCRVAGEESWRLCGEYAQFVSATRGPLEFLVNDIAIQLHEGSFMVAIRTEASQAQMP